MARWSGGSRHVAAGITLIVLLATASPSLTADTPRASRTPLQVLLTVSANLPSQARQVLSAEADRIWQREGVDIKWTTPSLASESADTPLRVLVVSRPQASTREESQWPVAELLPEATPRALAIASIPSAQRVVAEAARSILAGPAASPDHRLGLVLGRAVAHEIGHFLLATATHAERGLMRARIDSREFAAVNGESFRLDGDASRWLRDRLTSPDFKLPASSAGAFSYAFSAQER